MAELAEAIRQRIEEDKALTKTASDQALQRFSEMLDEFSAKAIESFRLTLETQLDEFAKLYRDDCNIRFKKIRAELDERQS